MKVFGSLCFVHIPKIHRHKLESKTKKAILVGYDNQTKGYCVYDPELCKVLITRDIVCDETKLGMEFFKHTPVP